MTATQDSTATRNSTQDSTARAVQVSRVYIKASADAIWTALTDPEWTNRYGYKGYHQYDLRPGGGFQVVPSPEFRADVEAAGYPCPDVLVDGEVIEAEAPHKLVTTWRMLMDPTTSAEPMTTITYEIQQFEGFCSLTVAHDVTDAPATGLLVSGNGEGEPGGGGGGHPWILSDLKSLLETGSVLAG